MAYQRQSKPRETVTGVIDKIWDERAMVLVDFGRMGAKYKSTLQAVTEGGTLAEGQQVTVEYTTNGQYKNAEKIVINQQAPANAAAAGDFDPTEKGGKHNRFKKDYRHPDEITRVEMLKVATSIMTATGELAQAGDASVAMPALTDLAELLQAFVEDAIDAEWVAENLGQPSGTASQAASEAAQATTEPAPEAQAAEKASGQPGPADGGGDAMTRWMQRGK